MKNAIPISEIMTKDVITLKTSDSLEYAEKLFKSSRIRHIPVIKNNKIVGMLSYNDLLRISFADAVDEHFGVEENEIYNMFTIDQIMTKNLISVKSTATVKAVAELLSKKEFHALPIIDDGKLTGIITTTDLINFLLKQLE